MNKIIRNHINELHEALNVMFENQDFELFDEFHNIIKHHINLLNEKDVIFIECGNCKGMGHHIFYDDKTICRSCLGLGGRYEKRNR